MNDVLGEWEIHHNKVLSSLTYWQQHGGSILYVTSSSSEDVEVEEQQLMMTALIFKTENVIKQLLVVYLIISVALHTHTHKQ